MHGLQQLGEILPCAQDSFEFLELCHGEFGTVHAAHALRQVVRLVDQKHYAAVWFVRKADESCGRGKRIVIVANNDVGPLRHVALELIGTNVVPRGHLFDAARVKHVIRNNGLIESVVDLVVVSARKRTFDGIAERR